MIESQENNIETRGKELETWKREQTESQKITIKKQKNSMKLSNANLPAGNPQTICHSIVKSEAEEQLGACNFWMNQ